MAQKTPTNVSSPAEIAKNVDHFRAVVVHCACECADTRGGPHDVFLWNARRLAEAVLYAVAEGTDLAPQVRANNLDMKELPRKLIAAGRLRDQLSGNFETLRTCGNVGAHAQAPDVQLDALTVKLAASAICHVVDWFFDEFLLSATKPLALQQALADLAATTPKPSRDQRHRQELTDLQDKIASCNYRYRDLELAAERMHEQLARAQGADRPIDGKRSSLFGIWGGAAVGVLGALLGAVLTIAVMFRFGAPAPGAPADKVPARLAEVATATAPTVPPGSDTLVAKGPDTAGMALAVTVADLAAPLPEAASQVAIGSAPPESRAVPVEPEPPATPPPVYACPSGALLVRGQKLRFREGPHPRPTWQVKVKGPYHVEVEEYCIDRAPVATAAYVGASLGDVCRPVQGNGRIKGASKLPINYVSRGCAEAHCEARTGRLPNIAEWELAMRQAAKDLALADDTGEYAADPYPFSVFGFGGRTRNPAGAYFTGRLPGNAKDEPILAWQRDSSARSGHPAVSFRCAYAARAVPPAEVP